MRTSRVNRLRLVAGGTTRHAVLIVVSVLLGFPLLWMVLTSLKTNSQALAVPVVWWPHPFLWQNYPQVLSAVPFYRFFLNTLLYAAVTIVGVCLSSSLVAYGFSRIRWRGRDFLFQVMVSTLLIPFFATLVPLFVMYKRFHMVGWYLPLMIPTFLGSSVFSTFLLRQFFMTIPQELSDAARIDGANDWQIYWRVILPLAKPALASLAILAFVWSWNDYETPLVMLTSEHNFTIPLGLTSYIDESGGFSASLIMAGAVSSVIPIIAVFLFMQRQFIQALARSGLKG